MKLIFKMKRVILDPRMQVPEIANQQMINQFLNDRDPCLVQNSETSI